ncbi:MAG: adenosylcobinamide-GDP ribazoletransferase [Candidatus Nanopelagicales bacterium]
MSAVRLAIGTFTIFPAGMPARVDRASARGAMLLAPLLGLLLGAIAAAIMWAVRTVAGAAYGDLLAATLAVGALAYMTRALHLDGLADSADALGSGRRGPAALEIARRGDIGPFGVATLVIVLLVDVAALAMSASAHHGTVAVVLAVATGRLAATWACVRGIPAARPEGLGALVAGTVPLLAALAWTVALAGIALGLAYADDDSTMREILAAPLSILVGLGVALLLVRRSVSRMGGITGDTLGATIEVGTCATLVAFALGA